MSYILAEAMPFSPQTDQISKSEQIQCTLKGVLKRDQIFVYLLNLQNMYHSTLQFIRSFFQIKCLFSDVTLNLFYYECFLNLYSMVCTLIGCFKLFYIFKLLYLLLFNRNLNVLIPIKITDWCTQKFFIVFSTRCLCA